LSIGPPRPEELIARLTATLVFMAEFEAMTRESTLGTFNLSLAGSAGFSLLCFFLTARSLKDDFTFGSDGIGGGGGVSDSTLLDT
jgi:hypothetical protein